MVVTDNLDFTGFYMRLCNKLRDYLPNSDEIRVGADNVKVNGTYEPAVQIYNLKKKSVVVVPVTSAYEWYTSNSAATFDDAMRAFVEDNGLN